jgi:two-component system, NarL family, response regulator DesR
MRLTPLKLLIADDHRLMLAAIRRVLAGRDDIEIVAEAAAGDEVVALAVKTRPDVVLLDIGMPGMDGIECARRLRRRLPDVRILMLTAYGDPATIAEAEEAGADGYVLKSVAAVDFAEAIRLASGSTRFLLAGFPEVGTAAVDLTERELAVLQAACEGLSNRQIGRLLWITDQTVRFHLKNILRKLGAPTRAEAVRIAHERGLVWQGERRAVARA